MSRFPARHDHLQPNFVRTSGTFLPLKKNQALQSPLTVSMQAPNSPIFSQRLRSLVNASNPSSTLGAQKHLEKFGLILLSGFFRRQQPPLTGSGSWTSEQFDLLITRRPKCEWLSTFNLRCRGLWIVIKVQADISK